jgi:hypothetical protein
LMGRSLPSLLGLALRDPDALPVFVVPEPPGWAGFLWIADAGTPVPVWRDNAPPQSSILVRGPTRLPPDLLRALLVTGVLQRLTSDGAPVRAVRSEIGYLGWSIESGVVQVEESTRVETAVLRCVRLCEDRRVGREALLVRRIDVAPLIATRPLLKERATPPRAGDIVSEDRAARALPWRRRDAVAWLRREGLSTLVDGRSIVLWDAVLDRIRPRQPSRRTRAPKSPPLLARPGRMLD